MSTLETILYAIIGIPLFLLLFFGILFFFWFLFVGLIFASQDGKIEASKKYPDKSTSSS